MNRVNKQNSVFKVVQKSKPAHLIFESQSKYNTNIVTLIAVIFMCSSIVKYSIFYVQ